MTQKNYNLRIAIKELFTKYGNDRIIYKEVAKHTHTHTREILSVGI